MKIEYDSAIITWNEEYDDWALGFRSRTDAPTLVIGFDAILNKLTAKGYHLEHIVGEEYVEITDESAASGPETILRVRAFRIIFSRVIEFQG